MKNVFSYKYGSIFTGKEIKDFLNYRKQKGYSLYGFTQYLSCKDDTLYRMVELGGTGADETKRSFVKVL